MLARLSGTLESLEAGRAIISLDGAGLAYEALLPPYLAERLASHIGQRVTLHTLEHYESQGGQGASLSPRLLAFGSRRDREFFELFTRARGLGARRALRALTEPPARVAAAIETGDAKALQRLPEIGKRLAETIISDLQGKLASFIEDANAAAPKPSADLGAEAERAIAALVRLGEPRIEAERMVRRAIEAEPPPSSADEILAAAYGARHSASDTAAL